MAPGDATTTALVQRSGFDRIQTAVEPDAVQPLADRYGALQLQFPPTD